jgi:phosphoglycerate kinase
MDKVVINQLPIEHLSGKGVFVRIDVDKEQSSSGVFFDENKLRASLPTLEYLKSVGARIIIGTHLDNPGRVVELLRLDALAKRLSELLDRPVLKPDEAVGRVALRAVTDMKDGDFLLLENLRFYPGEDANDSEFARELAQLCDIYCDDAFALAHRALASTVGITRYVRPAAAGLALAREVMMLEAVLEKPGPPFVGLVAGARMEEKLSMLENLLPRLNTLFIGGALSFAFMKARGQEVGAAPVDEAFLPMVEDLLDEAEKKDVEIVLPEDFIVMNADQFRAYTESGLEGDVPEWRRVLKNEILPSDLPVDVGPSTINRIKELFEVAHTIFWNGPLGVWEIKPFAAATFEVAHLIAERVSPTHQRIVVCGDSLARAIRTFDLPVERIRHLTSGGEAALQLLAGNPLPALSALDNEVDLVAPIEDHPRRILLPADGSEHSLEVARRLGQLVNADGAEISLLYVQQPKAIVPYDLLSDAETERSRDIERRLEAERVFGAINAALAHQGLTSHRQLMSEGDPADQILKFADQIGADLIGMGSHGRTGVLRLLMGSVSRKVLDHARSPVLIVRIPVQRMVDAGMPKA